MSKHVATPTLAVNVRELLRHPGSHKHVLVRGPLPDLVTPVAAVPGDAPVTVDAEVESVVEGLLVSGTVRARARLQCVRCLGDLTEELAVEVRELFALDPAAAEDEGYAVLAGESLPLDTLARDALVLAFPAAPLCRPDCAGLCPECGADRNQVDCGHAGAADDPRWAPLTGLRQRIEEDNDARP
jgi:uncharacterized protein